MNNLLIQNESLKSKCKKQILLKHPGHGVVTEDGLCMCDCKKNSESAISKKSDWAIKGQREKMFLSKAATSSGADSERIKW